MKIVTRVALVIGALGLAEYIFAPRGVEASHYSQASETEKGTYKPLEDEIRVDTETGCEYFRSPYLITPRLDSSGHPMCHDSAKNSSPQPLE